LSFISGVRLKATTSCGVGDMLGWFVSNGESVTKTRSRIKNFDRTHWSVRPLAH